MPEQLTEEQESRIQARSNVEDAINIATKLIEEAHTKGNHALVFALTQQRKILKDVDDFIIYAS